MANNVDLDQTAPIGAVWSGSTLFASILNSSVMLGNYLQQTTSADDIFKCIFLEALRVKPNATTTNSTMQNIFIGTFVYFIADRNFQMKLLTLLLRWDLCASFQIFGKS